MQERWSASGSGLDAGACAYGAGVLLKHLKALEQEVEGVRSGSKDIEYIHRARVASRRLRAALPLFEGCLPRKKSRKWLKQIKQVTRALGAARDTDVQIAWVSEVSKQLPDRQYGTGVRRLSLRLSQQRQALQAPVTEAMEKLVNSGVLEAMSAELQPAAEQAGELYLYTHALYQHSYQSIHTRLETFLSYEPLVMLPENVEALHQMRIAAKWLRYTMESFAPLYASQLKTPLQAVKKTQEMLGDIHDCDVWLAFLAQFLEEERQRTLDYFGNLRSMKRIALGIQYLAGQRAEARSQVYQQFLAAWERWKAEAVWENLSQAIQVPFPRMAQIYPPLQPAPEADEKTGAEEE